MSTHDDGGRDEDGRGVAVPGEGGGGEGAVDGVHGDGVRGEEGPDGGGRHEEVGNAMSSDAPGGAGDATQRGASRSKGRRRWPMSPLNTVLVLVGIAGAIIFFIVDSPFSGGILLVASVFVAVSAVLARRRGAGDLERINALEYADERDRAAAMKGLAAVGVAALALLVVQIIVAAVLGEGVLVSAATLLVLSLVWLIANWYFVRRG